MKHLQFVCALFLIVVAPCRAQDTTLTDWSSISPDPAFPQGENLGVPQGWKWRLDRTDPEARLTADAEPPPGGIRFVNMTPGWHITTGPAVILYHPSLLAEGGYRTEVKFHQFPPGERNEAFGLFVGGTDLNGDDQSYLYFLIRKTGEFLIKTRNGDSTSVLREWTEHPAIVPYTSQTEGTATNVLAIVAGADSLNFYVNEENLASMSRGHLPVDGLVGLRINHALNVHVSDLKVLKAK